MGFYKETANSAVKKVAALEREIALVSPFSSFFCSLFEHTPQLRAKDHDGAGEVTPDSEQAARPSVPVGMSRQQRKSI